MFNQYPYLNLNDLNLDYILKAIKEMRYEVTNFVSINAIKYADPIQWNITSQYEKNTIVIDPVTGTAYISVAPVPAGVALTRPEYWTVVFDLGSFVTRAAQNFTSRWESETTLTATFATPAGAWLVWGDVLYKALVNITAGDTYIINSNIEHFTIEDLYNAYLNTIASILAIIGDLDDLTTSDTTDIVHAINSVLNDLNITIGDLANLTTADKTSIVNAINELYGDIENLFFVDVAEMIAANLSVGDICKTTSFSDGVHGGAYYTITDTATANNMDVIALNNGLFAVLENVGELDITKLGVVPNATTDISDILQYAVDNYVDIYIPAGVFYFDHIVIAKAGRHIHGAGFRQTILYMVANHSNNDAITVTNTSASQRYFTINDLSIDNSLNGVSTYNGLVFDSNNSTFAFSDVFIDRVMVSSFNYNIYCNVTNGGFMQYLRMKQSQLSYGNTNLYSNGCYYVEIMDCYLQEGVNHSVELLNSSRYARIERTSVTWKHDAYAIVINGGRNTQINECQFLFDANTNCGIDMTDCVYNSINDNFVQYGAIFIHTNTNNNGGIISNNIFTVAATVILDSDSHTNSFTLIGNTGGTYKVDSNNTNQYNTGVLLSRTALSYSGALPATEDNITLGTNPYFDINNNVISGVSTQKLLVMAEFLITHTTSDPVVISIYNDATLIETFNYFGSGSRESHSFIRYLSNPTNITVKISSADTGARFNGGSLYLMNIAKQ